MTELCTSHPDDYLVRFATDLLEDLLVSKVIRLETTDVKRSHDSEQAKVTLADELGPLSKQLLSRVDQLLFLERTAILKRLYARRANNSYSSKRRE